MASTVAITSLNAVTTGTGSTVDFTTAKQNVSVVIRQTGTITGGAVTIESSHDSTNWVRRLMVHVALRDGHHSHDFFEGAHRYWRARVESNITGGGTVTVTFAESHSPFEASAPSYAFQIADFAGVASAYNYLALFNPTGSGKTLVIGAMALSSWTNGGITGAGSMVVKRITASSAGTLQADSAVAKFQTAFPDPVAEVRTSNPTVTAGAQILASPPINQNPGTSPVHQILTAPGISPLSLAEGEGIVITAAASDVDEKWNIGVVWSEAG